MRPDSDRGAQEDPWIGADSESEGWMDGTCGIDSADLAIAATAVLLDAALLTRNVEHFPMFGDLSSPY